MYRSLGIQVLHNTTKRIEFYNSTIVLHVVSIYALSYRSLHHTSLLLIQFVKFIDFPIFMFVLYFILQCTFTLYASKRLDMFFFVFDTFIYYTLSCCSQSNDFALICRMLMVSIWKYESSLQTFTQTSFAFSHFITLTRRSTLP